MNRIASLIVLVSVSGLAPTAWGENLPNAIKAASDATVSRPVIEAFVARQLDALKSDNPTSLQGGRASLIGQATSTPTPGASFLDVYADVLNGALREAATSSKVTLRLNAAIVTAEVAKHAGNARLAALAKTFMDDKCDGVALWGLKAAKYILPPQLSEPAELRQPDLRTDVLNVVKAHPESAAIIEEAYRTLTLETVIDIKAAPQGAIPAVIPELLKLLAFRVTLYDADAPPYPGADNEAVLFLSRTKVWAVEDSKQKLQAMRTSSDLGAALGKLIVVNPPRPDREDLLNQFHQLGKAFQVLADQNSNTSLQKAAADIVDVSASAPDTDFAQRVDALKAAIDSIKW